MTTEAPNPYAAAAAPVPTSHVDRWRWLLSGVIGIVGGYVTLASVSGPLLMALNPFSTGYPPEVTVQLTLQALFGVVLTVFGYLASPGGSGAGKAIAAGIWAVGVAATVALLWGRLFGEIRLGPAANLFINPWWLIVLIGALGWLVAINARGLVYLALLLTLVLMPLNLLFTFNGFSSGISSIVQYVVALGVAVAVLLIARPRSVVTAP